MGLDDKIGNAAEKLGGKGKEAAGNATGDDSLKAEGQTILVIDKNLPEMATLVDRHYIVDKGRVAWSGQPAELSAQPELAQRYLGI